MTVFLQIVLIGLKREFRSPIFLLSKAIFLFTILYIFSNLWRTAFASGFMSGDLPGEFVWYIYVTEAVMLSVPTVQRSIADEVRNGDIITRLLKPFPYPLYHFADGLGQTIARLAALMPSGFFFCWLLTSTLPEHWLGLSVALLLVPISAGVLLSFLCSIGLLAGWIFDPMPIYWIFSKALFVLGGLLLPLTIYPQTLRTVANFTPFPAMLFGIAQHVLEFSWSNWILSLAALLFWLMISFWILSLLNRLLTKQLMVTGG